MTETTLYTSNGMQTVSLPKEVAFPETVKNVTVIKDGIRRIINPVHASWDDFFDAPGIDLGDRGQLR